MIHKLEHIGIMVSNMDASIRFYTEVLGLQLARREQIDNGPELGFLSFPGSEHIEIELIGRGTEGLSGSGIVNHVAFTVSDIEGEMARLQDLGVRFEEGSSKVILNGVRIAFFQGPDGERLELFQPAP
ncbi:Glyoxalase/bleomycin resistance protein/dioxygenase [Paenibacillus mucilaginosus 3016]|uniref:Glyoxalase/bleomycin resistance protein/dioxygenase n=1 Tax=Paenibacillus mucilaginosus 3016 TaxID=1116391 RepID=H6N966_9BACL|nr:VOC family protein [Paenibacillus mucilaginosus]AFC27812.1 Glyoxalase/bleomycin resistance protein/dioxygenase [Paenibacillus mucilaginosus 3016]WFA16680.1 VOC family protein [Paenibacillus mucilaginosus]